MKSTEIGKLAEDRVAVYLKSEGFEIIDQNWRTPKCEIDVVARKGKVVYLVEVKYRNGTGHGTGIDYITTKKLKQMSFAAEVWAQSTNWNGDCQLVAIEVTGPDLILGQLVEIY